MNPFKKALGHACDNCPLCNYARNHPETTVGKVMEWHGKFCPMWKGQKELEVMRQGGKSKDSGQ
tara:strand:- start:247 stop:438 length:192 start_codon:yes stop_codon:yes gene_type:complete